MENIWVVIWKIFGCYYYLKRCTRPLNLASSISCREKISLNMTVFLYLSLLCIALPVSLSRQEAPTEGRERCNSFVSNYQKLRETFEEHLFTLTLTVDPENGSDNASCLNGSHSCRSITYALYGYDSANTSLPFLQVEKHDIEVVLLPGDHRLSSVMRIVNSSFVYIRGVDASKTTVRCTTFPNDGFPCVFDDLDIQHSNSIWIKDLTITECGPVSVGLHLFNDLNVIVENCIFTRNGGSGIFSFSSDKMYFVNNSYIDTRSIPYPRELLSQSCSNRVYSSVFDSIRGTAGGIAVFTAISPASREILIWNSVFMNNSATPPFEHVSLPNTLRSYGRGGGVSIFVMDSVDCHICVKDLVVRTNQAQLAAGGISFTLSGKATNNSLTIDNSIIANNTCETRECIGGGIHFTSEGQGLSSLSNTLYMYDSSVEYNKAEGGTGGGLVAVIFSNESRFFLSNCTFKGNVATHDGSGIVLLSVTGIADKGNTFSCWDW